MIVNFVGVLVKVFEGINLVVIIICYWGIDEIGWVLVESVCDFGMVVVYGGVVFEWWVWYDVGIVWWCGWSRCECCWEGWEWRLSEEVGGLLEVSGFVKDGIIGVGGCWRLLMLLLCYGGCKGKMELFVLFFCCWVFS